MVSFVCRYLIIYDASRRSPAINVRPLIAYQPNVVTLLRKYNDENQTACL